MKTDVQRYDGMNAEKMHIPAIPLPGGGSGKDVGSLRRLHLARSLMVLADQNLNNAKLLKSAAQELFRDASVPQPEQFVCLDADEVRAKLSLRCRGSALLLIELLATPGRPRKDEELAPIVCLRKQSTSSVKVFVHDLRSGLARAGLHGVVKRRTGRGYFVNIEQAWQVLEIVS